MSIQPSVLIWTVICFCLFALVFNGLIIKPVLKVIDGRRERLNKARSAKRAADEADAEAAAARAAALNEAERRERERLDTELDELRRQKEAEYAAFAESLRAEALNNTRGPEKLGEDAEAAVRARMDEMVRAFAEKLLSGGKE